VAFPPTNAPFARALRERDYAEPTPVQTAVLAADAAGRDLLVSAQTGSGKTIAFGLAIGATLLGDSETLGRTADPQALIIAPTRELALQVQRELTWLYQHTGARIVSCVGGMDPREERRQLNGGCHIVVGTPGRLRDHLERNNLRIAGLKAVVLDEADEMLDLGFREDLEFILKATPTERRTLLFSATLPKEIVTLARQFQRDAQRIATSAGERGHTDIEYRAIRIAAHDTEHAVVNLLRFIDSPSTLVFCNTRDAVRHLHATLLERGFQAVSLSGEFSQNERNHALQALRDGKATVCVATDVAARGIDLPNLGLVIHADLPNDSETLQHRSGRTGRAGRKGISVLLVTPPRRKRAELLIKTMRIQPVWANPPTAEDIRKLDDVRLLESLLQAEVGQPDDLALAKELLSRRPAEEIAAVLVRLHRARLPAPEEISDPAPVPRDVGRSWEPHKGPARKDSWRREDPNAAAAEGMVWFRLNVGRSKKADPKWLIPEICRQGGITKKDIGAIRIFDKETKFEITELASGAFAERIAQVTKGDIHIGPAGAPTGGEVSEAPRRPAGKPFFGKPKYSGKLGGKPGGKPSYAAPRKGPKGPKHKS
jgi:ATP-dependent RNA helicase DeaD